MGRSMGATKEGTALHVVGSKRTGGEFRLIHQTYVLFELLHNRATAALASVLYTSQIRCMALMHLTSLLPAPQTRCTAELRRAGLCVLYKLSEPQGVGAGRHGARLAGILVGAPAAPGASCVRALPNHASQFCSLKMSQPFVMRRQPHSVCRPAQGLACGPQLAHLAAPDSHPFTPQKTPPPCRCA